MKYSKPYSSHYRQPVRKDNMKLSAIRKAFDKGNNIYCIRNRRWWQGQGEKYAIYTTSKDYKEFKCPENWKDLSDGVKNMYIGQVFSFYGGGV